LGRVYDRAAWRKLRDAQLAVEPLCRHCREQGRTTAATDVDHILAINDGGDAWDGENLQSLCRSCHSRKTRGDQVGLQRGCNADGFPTDRRHHWNARR